MKYLPLMHRFGGRRCLIVGGGKIALRRGRRVVESGGVIHVIAPEVNEELAGLAEQCGGEVQRRPYRDGDVQADWDLAVAATDRREVNRQVAEHARAAGVAVNVVDDETLCDVIFPTVVNREPAQIAISSGSASPQFSTLLRDRINVFLPTAYGRLAELFGRYRGRVNETISDPGARTLFWNKVAHGHIAESALSGNPELAESRLREALENHREFAATGEVYLVGAGPGDPDLLTLRAFRLLQQADVVVYDRLVSQDVLDRLEEGKEMIYVGKRRSDHSLPQGGINQLLIDEARKGRRVARLKGGDPFVFGRGGEEIEQLARHGIPFQVIPGISAANGCAAYAGIPLTHRDHAQSVRFVTGQLRDGTVNLDWDNLVVDDQTLVFYMGLEGLPIICGKLIEHGYAADTPAALIEQGTRVEQKVYVDTLEGLPGVIRAAHVQAPTLIIVGSVVRLHASLKWF